LAKEVDLEQVARGTPGFSGADLANLLNEAALLAARFGKTEISAHELNEAADKVLMGLERSLALTLEELRQLAYHEAGHAVLGAILPNADPVHKVNIIPRGRAMGVTQQLPERDRYLYPREYMLDRMTVIMGGRAAEDLALNIITSGAADDLQQATRLARRMVMNWGMSDQIGHVAWVSEGQGYTNEDFGSGREYSDYTARELDQEVRRLVEEAYLRAKDLLGRHRMGLDSVVEVLLEKEQLYGTELAEILNRHLPTPISSDRL
jgi:cell division protease FtsH